MTLPKTVHSTKLFFKKYPYKITFKRLYGFPSAELLNMYKSRWGHYENHWWFPLPINDDDKDKRLRCLRYLKNNFEDIKVHNVSTTGIYFLHKDDFERAKKRYKEYHIEYTEPFIEELPNILEQYPESVELKKSLYFNKYRYKITLTPNRQFKESIAEFLASSLCENENYRLHKNVLAAGGVFSSHATPRRYISYYNTYNIYCKDKIDVEYVTFVACECISKINKVVLIGEIDK